MTIINKFVEKQYNILNVVITSHTVKGLIERVEPDTEKKRLLLPLVSHMVNRDSGAGAWIQVSLQQHGFVFVRFDAGRRKQPKRSQAGK